MRFKQSNADVYVPLADVSPEQALARTSHLCIAAHQDDIEIMAYAGIAACYGRKDRWFSGVVVTNGAGSPRHGRFGEYTDEQMMEVRRLEQRKAALMGEYSVQIQLGYPSAAVKAVDHPDVQSDLAAILERCTPEVVYLHQPADKHDTHIAVLSQCLTALRRLPAERRPKSVLGCEVWRDLDWLVDTDKRALDSGAQPHLAAALIGVFDSQIGGGKRYDLATIGRRCANATFHTSHATDQFSGITWAMDLTPLIENPNLDVCAYTIGFIENFRKDVETRLGRYFAARSTKPS
jgi:LmbE family N-acetylglucosaminyl deacetylase